MYNIRPRSSGLAYLVTKATTLFIFLIITSASSVPVNCGIQFLSISIISRQDVFSISSRVIFKSPEEIQVSSTVLPLTFLVELATNIATDWSFWGNKVVCHVLFSGTRDKPPF
jgi:hypothetical protein